MQDQGYVSRNPERQQRIDYLAGKEAVRRARECAQKAFNSGEWVDPFWVDYFGLAD